MSKPTLIIVIIISALPAILEDALYEGPDVREEQPLSGVGTEEVESDGGGEDRAGLEEEVEVLGAVYKCREKEKEKEKEKHGEPWL